MPVPRRPSLAVPALALALGSLLLAAPVFGAEPATATPAPSSAKAPETNAVTVIEDDGVRIEQTRVRGTVTRLRVQSKVGEVPAYDIQVAPPGRESMSDRGLAGQRTWSLLRF